MDPVSTPPAGVAPADTAAMKPGYKTTEFWLSTAATVVGLLIASGIIPATGPASALARPGAGDSAAPPSRVAAGAAAAALRGSDSESESRVRRRQAAGVTVTGGGRRCPA